MNTAVELLFFIGAVSVLIVIMTMLDRRFPCKCGRSAGWYFWIYHEKAGLMLGYAIFFTAWNVLGIVVSMSVSSVLFGVPLSCWYFLRWWKHEKDKIKKVAMGLGRVKVNEHGVLKVVPE